MSITLSAVVRTCSFISCVVVGWVSCVVVGWVVLTGMNLAQFIDESKFIFVKVLFFACIQKQMSGSSISILTVLSEIKSESLTESRSVSDFPFI